MKLKIRTVNWRADTDCLEDELANFCKEVRWSSDGNCVEFVDQMAHASR